MKDILLVDCCVRREQSRTARLARAFVAGLDETRYCVSVIRPDEERMKPLAEDSLRERDRLLAEGALDRPRFDYARQFAQADQVVMAAPFWDLSFPAILKVYIENISVEGITFRTEADGLHGLCRGERLIFLTTRGGLYGGTDLEQGSRYMAALKEFFGFGEYVCVAAEGLDTGADPEPLVAAAEAEAHALAASL